MAHTSIEMSGEDEFSSLKKIQVKNTQQLARVELKGLVDVFNSYATKKTMSSGFFNVALVRNSENLSYRSPQC